MTETNEKRLVARTNASIQQRIADAAELSGSTLSQFLVDAALEKANRITREATQLEVSREGFLNIMGALDRPARPMPRLRRAAHRYKELIHEDQEITAHEAAEQKAI